MPTGFSRLVEPGPSVCLLCLALRRGPDPLPGAG